MTDKKPDQRILDGFPHPSVKTLDVMLGSLVVNQKTQVSLSDILRAAVAVQVACIEFDRGDLDEPTSLDALQICADTLQKRVRQYIKKIRE